MLNLNYHDGYEAVFFLFMWNSTATPVGTLIPETPGTMGLHLEIILTEITPILVLGMTMGQCQEDTGMRVGSCED